MDCDGILSDPEIDVPNLEREVTSTSPHLKPIATFNDVEIPLASDTMGLEHTWDDEPMAIPLPPPPSPLPVFDFNESNDDLALLSPTCNLEDPLVEGSKGEPGVCGLHNLGNTCFMSAGVQSLMATAPMVVSLIRNPILPQHTLSRGLAGLAKMIWTSKVPAIRPTLFKESLGKHFSQFNDRRQHDCQEFLALLLDGLHEQMNTANKKETNVGNGGRDSPDSACKKFGMMDDQFYASTSHGNCDHVMESEDTGDTPDVQNRDEGDASDSRSAPGMNNVLNSKYLLRKENSEPLSCDNQLNNIFPSSMSGDGVHVMNNSLPQFSGLEDILKTAKTSNINVLNEQEEANNEIRFDSEKYPRRSIFDNPRRKCDFNTNSFHLYENNTSGKRQKSSVTYFSCAADFKEGLDWKRLKLHSVTDGQDGKNKKMELERQNKTGDAVVLEKNQRLACEQLEANEECSEDPDLPRSPNPKIAELKLLPDVENNIGEEHWRNHLAANRSVIVDTFQGQFKSTVVCSSCNFVSVTYEPFMYLSVPLPNAHQMQIHVTFISCSSNEPEFCVLEVNKYDSIATLKVKLGDKIDCDRSVNITMAEVLDHHISKILHDTFPIRLLKDSVRRLYAFEVISPVEIEGFDEPKVEEPAVDNSCTICFEEKTNMKQHDCSCKLCEQCISASCRHGSGRNIQCPVCRKDISPDVDLSPLQNEGQQSVRMINVPVVFRVDKIGDGNNNQKSVELFGHPRLLRLPSTISSQTLHEILKRFLPRSGQYKVLRVDGKGDNCSRCMYNDHCSGCVVQEEGDIDLSTSDTLAIAYSSPMNSENDLYRPDSGALRQCNPLTLYDCIQAFSKSEILDENNPWYCGRCNENRCATKTLTVWRCPDYLIVYLKRFVFYNSICTKLGDKVIFPLVGLSLPFSESAYDLYACVCHIGGVSAGHYTAYTRHPYTGQWHHFNDGCVTNQTPQEEDYHNAYILFYRKQGIEIPSLNNEDMARNIN